MEQRILIVDDEHSTRLVIRHMLMSSEHEYEIDEAADGTDALAMVEAKRYDLVLTDIIMPEMDGVELLTRLRKMDDPPPIVVLTALGDEEHILTCFARGAWDYMVKPVELRHMLAVVRRAIIAGEYFRDDPNEVEIHADDDALVFDAASDLEYVHRFRRFTEVLLRARVSSQVREDIRLAIEEIGKNAIEWGNRNERRKRVRMAYCLTDDCITFKIEDEGEGFRHDAIPDPSGDPLAHLEYRQKMGKRPGGYGIHIIEGVMDDVEYNEKGNAVILKKFLTEPPPQTQ